MRFLFFGTTGGTPDEVTVADGSLLGRGGRCISWYMAAAAEDIAVSIPAIGLVGSLFTSVGFTLGFSIVSTGGTQVVPLALEALALVGFRLAVVRSRMG